MCVEMDACKFVIRTDNKLIDRPARNARTKPNSSSFFLLCFVLFCFPFGNQIERD